MTIEEEPGRKRQLHLIILFIPVPPLFFSLFLFLFLSFSCAFIIPACSYKFPFLKRMTLAIHEYIFVVKIQIES